MLRSSNVTQHIPSNFWTTSSIFGIGYGLFTEHFFKCLNLLEDFLMNICCWKGLLPTNKSSNCNNYFKISSCLSLLLHTCIVLALHCTWMFFKKKSCRTHVRTIHAQLSHKSVCSRCVDISTQDMRGYFLIVKESQLKYYSYLRCGTGTYVRTHHSFSVGSALLWWSIHQNSTVNTFYLYQWLLPRGVVRHTHFIGVRRATPLNDTYWYIIVGA